MKKPISSFLARVLPLFLGYLTIALSLFAQTPSVFQYNLAAGQGSEKDPVLIPKPGGGFFLTYRLIRSNPDSSFAGLASLDDNLQPQWNRVLKSMAHTNLGGFHPEPMGGVNFLLSTYNTQTRYHAAWLRMDAAGFLLETVPLQDSANLLSGMVPSQQVVLSSGARMVLVGSGGQSKLLRVRPSGELDYGRSFFMQATGNPAIQISRIVSRPGSNNWYAVGRIANSSQGILLGFQDTVLVSNRVYAGSTPGVTGTLRDGFVYPNGDLQLLGTEGIALRRVNATGIPIWSRYYKVTGSFPQVMHVLDGGIWVTGSLSAGQAGGLVARFNPDGVYQSHTGQFQLGFSHEPVRSMAQLGNGQVLAVQKAFYANSNVVIGNQISTGSDFVCFTYIAGTIVDTQLVMVDSSTNLLRKKVERFGVMANSPISIRLEASTLVRGAVTCGPVSLLDRPGREEIVVFPNPVREEIHLSGLSAPCTLHLINTRGQVVLTCPAREAVRLPSIPPGLYMLEIPEFGFRKRVELGW